MVRTWASGGLLFVGGLGAGFVAFGMMTVLGFVVSLLVESFLSDPVLKTPISPLEVDGAAASAAGMKTLSAKPILGVLFEQTCKGPCDDVDFGLAEPTRLEARKADGSVIAEAHDILSEWTHGIWPTPRWRVGGAPLRVERVRP
jgi:hypothetical protein